MRLVVGCPVRQREWIIKDWFESVEAAAARVDLAPTYAFVGDPADATLVLLHELAADHRRNMLVAEEPENLSVPFRRKWNEDRYDRMAFLRNTLLELVRDEAPEYFLSADSDILLHPEVLRDLLESVQRFDAVGGACHMMEHGERCPNVAWFLHNSTDLRRQEIRTQGVIPAGIIMALKLMTPAAYDVAYVSHMHGEDIGWSQQCANRGVKLGWDNRHVNKHILEPRMLGRFDERAGW
jgi:hypothetical protein